MPPAEHSKQCNSQETFPDSGRIFSSKDNIVIVDYAQKRNCIKGYVNTEEKHIFTRGNLEIYKHH